jgi:hypothetical protein
MMPPLRPFFFLFLVLLVFSSSCRKSKQEKALAEAQPYNVTNLYPIERLPVYFNRVVVMPVHLGGSSQNISEFVDDVVNQELAQARLFETVRFSSQSCKSYFGKERINSSDSLPDNFLEVLKSKTQANGVLFVDVMGFQSYRPLSISLRAKLVDLNSGDFMWAVDETIDSSHASVIAASRLYENTHHVRALSAKTSSSVLQSPRSFTKFSAHKIFSSLPSR